MEKLRNRLANEKQLEVEEMRMSLAKVKDITVIVIAKKTCIT